MKKMNNREIFHCEKEDWFGKNTEYLKSDVEMLGSIRKKVILKDENNKYTEKNDFCRH